MPFSSDIDETKGTLKRADTGKYEQVQADVEYFSPNQQGGFYGKIIRRYTYQVYPSSSNSKILFTDTNIDKIIDAGGSLSDNDTSPFEANLGGYSSSGLRSGISMYESSHEVWMTPGTSADDAGDSCNVWVDYTVDVEPVFNP